MLCLLNDSLRSTVPLCSWTGSQKTRVISNSLSEPRQISSPSSRQGSQPNLQPHTWTFTIRRQSRSRVSKRFISLLLHILRTVVKTIIYLLIDFELSKKIKLLPSHREAHSLGLVTKLDCNCIVAYTDYGDEKNLPERQGSGQHREQQEGDRSRKFQRLDEMFFAIAHYILSHYIIH